MKRLLLPLFIVSLLFITACDNNRPAGPSSVAGVAEEGTVTLADIGSLHCRPCLMMMPILARLEKDYQGQAAVKFIDVEKEPEAGRRLQIMTIPTQIIYDRKGKEVLRHVGFFPEDQLRKALDKVVGR